jgi:hypothetical protein
MNKRILENYTIAAHEKQSANYGAKHALPRRFARNTRPPAYKTVSLFYCMFLISRAMAFGRLYYSYTIMYTDD